jgi:excisionase family DNA binding protein
VSRHGEVFLINSTNGSNTDERSGVAEYLKLPEVARRLDVSEKTARRYVKSGVLPSVFIGNAYRVREEDLQEYLRSARVEPGKAPRRSLSEPSFNDVLEEEQREATYGPWLKFVDRYAGRWEARIAAGDLDLGSINEFARVLDELSPVLAELEKRERLGIPTEEWGDAHENLKMNLAIGRLMSLFNPLLAAAASKFENSELEQVRRKRAELDKRFAEAG